MAKTDIICAGFGGQGVLVAGLILATAAMDEDKHILWYPSYGVEMRGGTANCNVKISDEEIASPFATELDILFAMNEASINKFEGRLLPNAYLFYNSSVVAPDRQFRPDVKAVGVPANEIAGELGNPKGANIVMLGALAKTTGLFGLDYLKRTVDAYFENKGKHNPKNAPCFDRGAAYVS
ncbi:MAG: 2-oxoacid:acceptor oxidoreductase family protein [Deltaproteobacteria bacterium]|nr:2-oxoacid:acceptor oxidoreductase family protein [Deltaproteobacteria bacterium]